MNGEIICGKEPSRSPFFIQRFRGLRLKSLFSIADQVSSATVGFLVAIYVGREMSANGLGVFAITGAIVLIVHASQNSAVLEAMSVFGSRRPPAERRKYLGFLFTLDVLWVGGITGLGALELSSDRHPR